MTATASTGPKAESKLLGKLSNRYKPPGSGGEITHDTTIEKLARKWLKQIDDSKRARNTAQRYKSVTEGHIIAKLGGLTIDELVVAKMEDFFDKMKSEVGRPTAQLARVCLSGMYALASRLGAARWGNIVKLTTPVDHERKPVIALDREQVQLVRKLMRSDHLAGGNGIADMVDLMLATGARIGEIVVLEWKHLDLDAAVPTILIEATAIWPTGVGLHAQPYPKGGDRARRQLVLPSWAVSTLRARRELVPHEPMDLVFYSRAKTIRHPNNVRTQISEARARVGLLDLPMNPHTYRKTVGTKIGREDIEKAASQLGHASSETTRRHYVMPTQQGPDTREYLDDFAVPD
ncbi:tyrosine-type recombinase/integrase [Nocardia sp. NBC_01377]|uniref:tyrosine-type recombinase/integrase n=1 Tax=Nocardia sp. NBC_01377 TaxID=2903595 RepID=UPI003248095A